MVGILYKNIKFMLENYIPSNIEEYEDGDYSSLSDEGSNCDMEYSSFVNGDYTGAEEYYDNNFFRDDLEWDTWYPIGNDYDVPVPHMNDHYNGRHWFKQRVGECFDTVLRCVFNSITMNHELFQRLAFQLNKYPLDNTRKFISKFLLDGIGQI